MKGYKFKIITIGAQSEGLRLGCIAGSDVPYLPGEGGDPSYF
jgi:hypothetical protein